MAAKVYTLANNKGGITKTTSTVNLGYGLARRGYKTLIIDADAQCNTTYTLLGEVEYEDDDTELSPSLYDVILGVNGDQKKKRDLQEIIVSVPQQENLFLARGSIALSAADLMLAGTNGREKILRRAIDQVMDEYDFILIDTPPTLGVIPVNAFVAAGSRSDRTNGIIVPIAPQAYSVLGIRTLENAFEQMRYDIEIPLPIFGVICANAKNTKNARLRLNQAVNHFGSKIFGAIVPVNEKIEEAADEQISIYEYAPTSTGAIAYTKITNELLLRSGVITQQEAMQFLEKHNLYKLEETQHWESINA
jgi:chromosome partitioning protein